METPRNTRGGAGGSSALDATLEAAALDQQESSISSPSSGSTWLPRLGAAGGNSSAAIEYRNTTASTASSSINGATGAIGVASMGSSGPVSARGHGRPLVLEAARRHCNRPFIPPIATAPLSAARQPPRGKGVGGEDLSENTGSTTTIAGRSDGAIYSASSTRPSSVATERSVRHSRGCSPLSSA
ncbi:unnamed protein product [Amoebophrya sp. A25]|nr:unnamed protein product [Amoebophrya sp. A25]|eukprot:GSA25T00023572001.1